MERKIANIDEFQMDENETPILPAGLREEECLYVLPDGRYLPCGLYRGTVKILSQIDRGGLGPALL